MKYKGIIFSAPMVRANRAGLKTQTRRIMKPQPPACYEQLSSGPFHPTKVDRHGEEYPGEEIFGAFSEDGEFGIKAPMQPGEICYVKEAWGVGCRPCPHRGWVDGIEYRADLADLDEGDLLPLHEVTPPADFEFDSVPSGWRSSMFMPRWVARDWIRIENVRAERVRDITEVDALAEGMQEPTLRDLGGDLAQAAWSERQVYARLWRRLHGPGAWERNDWVWAYTYSRIEKPEDA